MDHNFVYMYEEVFFREKREHNATLQYSTLDLQLSVETRHEAQVRKTYCYRHSLWGRLAGFSDIAPNATTQSHFLHGPSNTACKKSITLLNIWWDLCTHHISLFLTGSTPQCCLFQKSCLLQGKDHPPQQLSN